MSDMCILHIGTTINRYNYKNSTIKGCHTLYFSALPWFKTLWFLTRRKFLVFPNGCNAIKFLHGLEFYLINCGKASYKEPASNILSTSTLLVILMMLKNVGKVFCTDKLYILVFRPRVFQNVFCWKNMKMTFRQKIINIFW